ncbi:hypothetical protein ABG088_11175 [Hydrogenibacillus schlegelii]
MTDPRVTQEGAARIGMEGGFRALILGGETLKGGRCPFGLPSFLLGFPALFPVIPRRSGNAKRLEENRPGSRPLGQRLLRQTDALLKRKLISLPCPRKFVRRAISTSFLPRRSTQSPMRFWDPLFVRGRERSAPFSRRGSFPFKRGHG